MHSEKDPDKCGDVLRRVRGAERSNSESRRVWRNWLGEVCKKCCLPNYKGSLQKKRENNFCLYEEKKTTSLIWKEKGKGKGKGNIKRKEIQLKSNMIQRAVKLWNRLFGENGFKRSDKTPVMDHVFSIQSHYVESHSCCLLSLTPLWCRGTKYTGRTGLFFSPKFTIHCNFTVSKLMIHRYFQVKSRSLKSSLRFKWEKAQETTDDPNYSWPSYWNWCQLRAHCLGKVERASGRKRKILFFWISFSVNFWDTHRRTVHYFSVIIDVRRKFFMQSVVRCWHRLPREAVDTPSLDMFKASLDGALGRLIWCLM